MLWCWEGGEKQPTQENREFLLLFLERLPPASENTDICITFFTATSGSLTWVWFDSI